MSAQFKRELLVAALFILLVFAFFALINLRAAPAPVTPPAATAAPDLRCPSGYSLYGVCTESTYFATP